MDPYMSEIRMFAGNFAPLAWAFCDGSLLPISDNTALFSLLGTTYGGDGQTTFALPDLRGRVPVGTGQGPGLTNVFLGEQAGAESVTLTSAQMAAHNHTNVVTATATCAPFVINDSAIIDSPEGTYLAQVAGVNRYATTHDAVMGSNPITGSGTAVMTPAGGSQAHDNMQPSLAVQYIICVEGIYPSRN
jgi:microcystin-dependent protein